MTNLLVNMFGDFTIRAGDQCISDSDNRSRKLWFLLAYLIYNRHRVVKQNELIDILWSENDKGANSVGALKTLFYRVRSELDALWDGAGKQLILYQSNGYMWNPNYPITVDFEQFDALNDKISHGEESLEDTIELLRIHSGDFLSRLSSELWVIPIATYYHNAYITNLLRALPVLLENNRLEEAVDFCRNATAIEPYHEEIHCFYMRAYIAMGKQKRAIEVYQKFSDRLFSELGIIPSEETRRLYYEAMKSTNDHTLSLEMLKDQLQEKNSYPGALICEYDFFRVLYYSMARSVLRNGMAIHLALFSVSGKQDAELTAKKREKVMGNLEEVIRCSLRRGDSAARCSATQYVVMLPRANYEDSCKVCDRILKAYYLKFSRMDADFRYEVFPIQPDEKENFQWMR